MISKRQNCWEYKKCGRNINGVNAEELGTCPAAADETFDGINSGKNGGRICWAVAGTFCGGKVQGTYAEKRKSCMECKFFELVRSDEGTKKLDSKFLQFIVREDGTPLIENMVFQHIKAGERFIFQGEIGDKAFIIQSGSCLAIVEKSREFYPVNHYGEGDIVGGLGLLTGEARQCHVDAETDMKVWVLSQAQFEDISEKDPEILDFLTEIVADRFDSKRPTAFREIGKYLTTYIIGRGAFSIVYKGIHSGLNMPVAIKMMRHHLAANPDFLVNFQNEAQIIASLDHENIVNVYDIEERFRTVFIIMEIVEGQSLRDMIDHLKTIPPPLAAYFLVQICRGLEYAHERGIIHRDINPTNIIVQRNDQLKILDFGLACFDGTEAYTSAGTLFYMSPEQIEGDAVDPRADIYSVGIAAYEMVTGKRPFPEDDHWELRNMHLTMDIPDPVLIAPDLPEQLRHFIIKACRRDPEQRYQNVNQALEDLLPLAQKSGKLRAELSEVELKMTNILLTYDKENQYELNLIMDEFASKVQELGAGLQIADFREK